ncbi:MAG TPA: transaldolase [Acidimicrobiales bacterium]|nr:transaldolase [Acidimicrobiales bacterium]
MTTLHALHDQGGQSPWLDNLRRDALASGELERLVAAGIRGVTSNPTIFQRSVLSGSDYDDQLRSLLAGGRSIEDAYWDMAITDVTAALDLLHPLYGESAGADGFVSIEVAGTVAHDLAASLRSARWLHDRIARPNLLVKIPATDEGIPAIRQLTAEGHSVNVTLIFGLERYAQVIEAYLSGLEARDGDLSGIHSVASFFLSRVDAEVDRRLERIGSPAALSLRGRAAVAQAELAYELFCRTFSGPRWHRLARRGARVQRPLWASTSTKNPAYPDLLYVTGLVAPDTVNTMTEATIAAFLDHGTARPGLGADAPAALDTLERLGALGVEMGEVSRTLEEQGVQLFIRAFEEVLGSIRQKAGGGRAAA